MQPISVVFFGISGSGKGTQAELLENYLKEHGGGLGVIRPEMGNLLRTFMQTGTSLAGKTGEIVLSGGLVPSFMPIYMLTGELNARFDGTQHLVLDGTCRRPDQSRAVDDMMKLWGRKDLSVISLDLTPESAKARLVARGRADDAKDEAIASRFAWYQEQVVPAMDELEKLGWTIHHIDGEPGIDAIHKNILSVLGLA
ncbi:MAG TPA: nucleoside monophosphate kinase [Candidatus Paceibacterota bacterium]|jgi:adenylate kinase family enzyme|nr:nucleoside monophosphate kinase [Candidatus Paceibacterota bacterium]